MTEEMAENIVMLRRVLHQNAELAGHEKNTSEIIRHFLASNTQAEIITGIGGYGLAAVFDYGPGPSVMIRCELDAIPSDEPESIEYHSLTRGVSHKCGHDGHMAIVAGLALKLTREKRARGRVILLFQPAEETGEGAHSVINDTSFRSIEPDYLFALHNIPGEPLNTVFISEKEFAATVQSVAIYLTGVQSHASEPEKGINPALAMSRITGEIMSLCNTDLRSDRFALVTPVYMTMGSPAYGISAGSGELHYTLRAWSDGSMANLKQNVTEITSAVCSEYSLEHDIRWFDYFPSTVNDSECSNIIVRAAESIKMDIQTMDYPYKFGEDFGWYTKRYKAAMFGIGSGETIPPLHHPDYDFPEGITDAAVKMFSQIISEVLMER